MSRCLRILFLIGFLALTPALAQGGNVAEARRLADSLAAAQELPVNVRLRMQLLGDMMGGLAAKGDSSAALAFFSTTRILVWNRPLSPATGQQMRAFEQQVVALARDKGFNLDLPPVGYSSAGVAGGAQPLPAQASPRDLLTNVSTREGLYTFTLRAEEAGTEALARGGTPGLQAVRDSLTVLRQDLTDAQVSSEAVRNVLLARARFLSSPESGAADPAFVQALDAAIEALRTNFPPDKLRSARGGQVAI